MNLLSPIRFAAGSLCGQIRAQAERAPERLAVRFISDPQQAPDTLDCAALDRRACSLAARLQDAGARGERVLIVLSPGLDYVVALLGCLYAGATAVPSHPPRARNADALAAVARDAQARFAISLPALFEPLADPGAGQGWPAGFQWLDVSTLDEADASHWMPPDVDPNSLAVLQYTSGSTTVPRGVRLTHANFLANIEAMIERNGMREDDRVVSWLPPFHDMGLVSGILLPLSRGLETTLMAPSSFLQRPLRWLQAISEFGGTLSGGPNFAYELCARRAAEPAQLAGLDLSRWRVAFCGAERVRAASLARFAQTFAAAGLHPGALVGCYGLAESTVGVSFGAAGHTATTLLLDEQALGAGQALPASAGRPAQVLTSCGEPLAGCELRIVDPATGRPLTEDQIGEIWVRGPSVAAGYWGHQALEREVFHARLTPGSAAARHEYLRTGDLGFLHQGELFIAGRTKDLLVLRGANHHPEDFEATMQAAHPLLATHGNVAISVDDQGEEQLVLIQEVSRPRRAPLAEIDAALRESVARVHEVAVRDVLLVKPGALPRTSSGKIQRGACRRLYLDGSLERLLDPFTQITDAAAPAACIAEVAATMAGLLGLECVADDADFFSLGGHSLLATQLMSRLRLQFGVDLTLRAVFEAPSPRQLAARICAAPALDALPPIDIADRSRPLALSFSQERMWLMHQLDPQGAAYNVAGGIWIDGPLDVLALQRALDELLRRHEVLRTCYPAPDGIPVAVVRVERQLELPLRDLRGASDPEASALAAASRLARQPFDVAVDTLIRVALWQVGTQRHLLVTSLHHLVTDAWSIGLLVADLLKSYDALLGGHRLPAVPATLSYIDYAQWQRRHLGTAQLAVALDYWKIQLAGAGPIELPSDRPRSEARSSAGDFLPVTLSDRLMNGLSELGAAQGATLFMVLLAAFELLLHRHTGSQDLVVAVPVANRNQLASESLMGSLVNTLAVRVRLDPDGTFLALLRQVRETLLDAYAHQDLPFERLVAALPLERRAGESPLLTVMFDFQNTPVPGRHEGPLRISPAMVSRGAAQFDLSLLIFDTELGRSAGIEYRTALFDQAAMQRLLAHFLNILEQVVHDPGQTVAGLPLLVPAERAALLSLSQPDWSPADPAGDLPGAIAAHAGATPQAIAVCDALGELSYAALEQQSGMLGARLRLAGAAPGERVAVMLERDVRLVSSLLAVLKSGAAYVPLDPDYPSERIGHVLDDSRPRVILTTQAWCARLPETWQARCLCIDDAERLAEPLPPLPPLAADPQRIAYVLYTSGSTGRPKGVAVSTGALDNFLRSMAREPGIDRDDRVLALTTVAFDIAGLELWLPLLQGAQLRLVPASQAADAQALRDLMIGWRPTLMQATPATWKLLLAIDWEGDPGLRMLCGGEALPPELGQALLARGAALWNMYGPTETTIWSTLHRVSSADKARVPIGRPIDHTRIYVLDRLGQLQPQGVAGELYIGGAGVADGYFGREDLSAQRFLPDPFSPRTGARMYRTGDAGRLRADGTFECLARLDDQIKLRGFRIEPGEIEAVMKEDPRVRDAVVQVREVQPGDPRLVAWYVASVLDQANPELEQELRQRLQQRLPAYMIPTALMPLAALPRTPNGKTDRRALPTPPLARSSASGNWLAPRDALEADLAGLWEELLGIERIGVRDSFFALGGHSLLAMRLFARIEQRFGIALPPAVLFEHPSIEHLARSLRACSAPPNTVRVVADAATFEHLVPINPHGKGSPLFCIHGAGGHVFNFSQLAEHLGREQSVYGLQARGTDGVSTPHASIEQMATAYLAELRAVQPHGPYCLLGYCGGGIIAFEMARRIRDAGEELALLALIDCYRPGVATLPTRAQRWTVGLRAQGGDWLRQRLSLWTRRQGGSLLAHLQIRLSRLRGRAIPFELRDLWLTEAFVLAARRYEVDFYPDRLTVLRATDVDPELLAVSPDLGWATHAAAVQSFDVPGNHLNLLDAPNIETLAAILSGCLQASGLRRTP